MIVVKRLEVDVLVRLEVNQFPMVLVKEDLLKLQCFLLIILMNQKLLPMKSFGLSITLEKLTIQLMILSKRIMIHYIVI